MAIEKSYIYKIFRDGNFLGVLPNVTSPFKYTLNINSAGAALEIIVGQDPYEAQTEVDELITESGDTLITESGDTLVTERAVPIFGNDWDGAMIRNGNDVQVFEVSENYPEGVQVFEGYISRWRVKFGSGSVIACTVLSYGAELDNYIIQTGNTEQAAMPLSTTTKAISFARPMAFAQIFTPTATMNLSQIELKMHIASGIPVNVTVDLCQGNPATDLVSQWSGAGLYQFGTGNSYITSSATVEVANSTAAVKTFVFADLPTLAAGTQYYFRIYDSTGNSFFLRLTTAGSGDLPLGYAMIGQMYFGNVVANNTTDDMTYDTSNPALFITVYSSGGSVLSPYTSEDPADILTSIIDNYVGQGGNVNYDTGTIEATGTSRSYTFNLATTLEGIKKVLDLSPANWYWRVDPATSTIYFKQVSTTGDHKMVIGQHIAELDLEANIENVKNVVYFSGGDIGGSENLFIKDQDADSLELYPQGLGRISDNRVTLESTAQALVDNFLDTNSSEGYVTMLVIPDSVYDITLFHPGETISFGGAGNMVDRLVLQIVSMTPEANKVSLGLGMLTKRASAEIEAAQRSLIDIQTVDNPDVPS